MVSLSAFGGDSRFDYSKLNKFRGSSNGRTPGFGPGYLGSNPGPRATKNDAKIRRYFFIPRIYFRTFY
jgi:hypothetical protein